MICGLDDDDEMEPTSRDSDGTFGRPLYSASALVTLSARKVSNVPDIADNKQYLRMRDAVAPETYCMAPYLQALAVAANALPSCAQARTGWQWSQAAELGRQCLVTSACASAAAARRLTTRPTWCSGVRRSAWCNASTRICSRRGLTACEISWDGTRRRWRRSYTHATRQTRS